MQPVKYFRGSGNCYFICLKTSSSFCCFSRWKPSATREDRRGKTCEESPTNPFWQLCNQEQIGNGFSRYPSHRNTDNPCTPNFYTSSLAATFPFPLLSGPPNLSITLMGIKEGELFYSLRRLPWASFRSRPPNVYYSAQVASKAFAGASVF